MKLFIAISTAILISTGCGTIIRPSTGLYICKSQYYSLAINLFPDSTVAITSTTNDIGGCTCTYGRIYYRGDTMKVVSNPELFAEARLAVQENSCVSDSMRIFLKSYLPFENNWYRGESIKLFSIEETDTNLILATTNMFEPAIEYSFDNKLECHQFLIASDQRALGIAYDLDSTRCVEVSYPVIYSPLINLQDYYPSLIFERRTKRKFRIHEISRYYNHYRKYVRE